MRFPLTTLKRLLINDSRSHIRKQTNMAPDPKRKKDPSDPHLKFLKTSRDLITFARNHMNTVGAISADIHRLSESILQESVSRENSNSLEIRINIPQATDDNHQTRSPNVNSDLREIESTKLSQEYKLQSKDDSGNGPEFKLRKIRRLVSDNSDVKKGTHLKETEQRKPPVMYPRIINMEIKNSNELSIKSVKPIDDFRLPDVISSRNFEKLDAKTEKKMLEYNGTYNKGLGKILPDFKPKETKPKLIMKKPICAFKVPESMRVDNIVHPIQLHRAKLFNANDFPRKRSSRSRGVQRLEQMDDNSPQRELIMKVPNANDRNGIHLPKIQVTRADAMKTPFRLEKLQQFFNRPLNTTWPRVEEDFQDVDIETYQLSPSIKSSSKRVFSRFTSSPASVVDQAPSPKAPPGKRLLKRKDTVILPKINPAPPPTREDNSPCFHRHYLTPSPRLDSFPHIAVPTPTGRLSKGVSFLYPQLFP